MKLFSILIFSFVFALFTLKILASNNVWAAACCARSAATPILILGDDEAQINVGFSFAKVLAEPLDTGTVVWKDPDTSELNRIIKVDGATLITDRFQVGASLNLVNHRISGVGVSESRTALGDMRVSGGYEILPSWEYSIWKPQGYLFTVLTLPTGRSLYESKTPGLSDVTGNGFFSLSVGNLLMKRWSRWDTFILPEIHYSLPRSFESFGEQNKVIPGFGGSFGVGIGFSPGGGDIRLGARIQPKFDQGRKVISASSSSQTREWIMSNDLGLDMSYLLSTNDTVMLSYTDQTLIGPASSTNLNRVFAINFQHRWER
jgi:hypothetical protein